MHQPNVNAFQQCRRLLSILAKKKLDEKEMNESLAYLLKKSRKSSFPGLFQRRNRKMNDEMHRKRQRKANLGFFHEKATTLTNLFKTMQNKVVVEEFISAFVK